VVGWLLLAMGIVGFIGTIGYLAGHKILEYGVMASGVIYLAACLVMVPMFLQESQLLEAALGKK
ncbi:MAG: hypothetical protein ONB05_07930, partial [candidate division KSB1 bacterium]|nr:hypothetical protein [candidate division KSB1 bacterium]